MLVSGKRGCDEFNAVTMICRTMFPYDTQVPEVPFIKKLENGSFWNYENQFAIIVRDLGTSFGFVLQWHCGYSHEDCVNKEKAIAILHEHMFRYQPD